MKRKSGKSFIFEQNAKFGIVSRSLCTFCNADKETPFHIFLDFTQTQNLWDQRQTYISENLVIPCLTPQSVMFNVIDTQLENLFIINHLLLKFNIFLSQEI